MHFLMFYDAFQTYFDLIDMNFRVRMSDIKIGNKSHPQTPLIGGQIYKMFFWLIWLQIQNPLEKESIESVFHFFKFWQ